jgi:4-hydroxybenzoate polyprenyltransferase
MATMENPPRETPDPTRRRTPPWLRILLMILLFLTVSVAFYLNFRDVMERLSE